jgi:hypothetical protein
MLSLESKLQNFKSSFRELTESYNLFMNTSLRNTDFRIFAAKRITKPPPPNKCIYPTKKWGTPKVGESS